MKKENSIGKAKSRSATAKPQQQVKDYQPQYKPCLLTDEERARVRQGSFANAHLNHQEVNRVAHNIAAAIANPETPEIVRAHIRAYLDDHLYRDWTQDPEMILSLYPIICRRISKIPFVPKGEYIETLTGNNKQAAIEMTKEDWDIAPHKPITEKIVASLTSALFEIESGNDDEIACIIIGLIVDIGYEMQPAARKRLVDEACHVAYANTVRYSKEEFAFIDRAIAASVKDGAGKVVR